MSSDFPRIEKVARLSGKKLALEFDDGRIVVADFEGVAARGGVFEPLNDPVFFRKVRAARGGRALAWPQGLDFCADALYVPQARPRQSPPAETPFGAKVFVPV